MNVMNKTSPGEIVKILHVSSMDEFSFPQHRTNTGGIGIPNLTAIARSSHSCNISREKKKTVFIYCRFR